MQLFLIRHGETDWNKEERIQGNIDTPLNATGIAQAERLAERLALEELEIVYASPLSRARTTAELIAQKAGIPLKLDERLKEKALGQLEGLTRADFEKTFPEVFKHWVTSQEHVPLPGEESPNQVLSRVNAFLDDVRVNHVDSKRVAIVSHGGTISMFCAALINLDARRRSPFVFDNASVTMIDLGGSRPRIHLLNDTCHLREEHLQDEIP